MNLPITVVGVVIAVVGVIAATAISAFFIMRSAGTSQMQRQVTRSGVEASATIVRTWDTGWRSTQDPRIGMLLQVQPQGGAPFQAEVVQTVALGQVGMFQPGAQLTVKYDPADHKRLAVVSLGG